MAQTTWSTLGILCIIGLVFPSITVSLLWFNLPEKITSVFFPLRTLVYRKIRMKNDLLSAYSDIRRKKGVNGFAVIWYVFAVLAIIVLGIFTIAGLTEEFVKLFTNVILVFFILCLLAVVIGVFFGDRQSRTRISIPTVDPLQLHEIEEALAHEVYDRIQDEQETVMQKGMRWVIDVLCTDHLSDEPNPALKGALTPFMGIANTNPVYMSHLTIRLLDEDDAEVIFPAKRRNTFDISYTQGKILVLFSNDYVADQAVRLIRDVTKMF